MKNTILISVLLYLAFSNSLWSAVVDTVWVSDYKGEIKFQHPITKNLLLRSSISISELDSKDGKLVREFDLINEYGIDMTPDGSKILSNVGGKTIIYDYQSKQLIANIENSRLSKFVNNNEIVLETSKNAKYSILAKYNLVNNEKTFFEQIGNIQDIATSPDGRFIAISTNAIPGNNENWTKLFLLDAITMTQIALLEEVKNTGHNYLRMNFSHDGKYLTTNSSLYNEDFQRNIYNTETLKPVKNYNPSNLEYDLLEIVFISNNLYFLQCYKYKGDKSVSYLVNIESNDVLMKVDNGAADPVFNKDKQHLYFREGLDGYKYCLNLSNLITGASTPQMDTIVNYLNKILTIKKENIKSIEISDISGRIILNKINDNPISNNTILPINLANGAYLINITTDKENFTHKLLVME